MGEDGSLRLAGRSRGVDDIGSVADANWWPGSFDDHCLVQFRTDQRIVQEDSLDADHILDPRAFLRSGQKYRGAGIGEHVCDALARVTQIQG